MMTKEQELNLHLDNMRRIKALQDQVLCNFPGSTPQERHNVMLLIKCVYGREKKEVKKLESELTI